MATPMPGNSGQNLGGRPPVVSNATQRFLLNKFGTYAALAEQLEVSRNCVRVWGTKERIPTWARKKLREQDPGLRFPKGK
jgi:hypothetical protein